MIKIIIVSVFATKRLNGSRSVNFYKNDSDWAVVHKTVARKLKLFNHLTNVRNLYRGNAAKLCVLKKLKTLKIKAGQQLDQLEGDFYRGLGKSRRTLLRRQRLHFRGRLYFFLTISPEILIAFSEGIYAPNRGPLPK